MISMWMFRLTSMLSVYIRRIEHVAYVGVHEHVSHLDYRFVYTVSRIERMYLYSPCSVVKINYFLNLFYMMVIFKEVTSLTEWGWQAHYEGERPEPTHCTNPT
jgi:hypothetical protein